MPLSFILLYSHYDYSVYVHHNWEGINGKEDTQVFL